MNFSVTIRETANNYFDVKVTKTHIHTIIPKSSNICEWIVVDLR